MSKVWLSLIPSEMVNSALDVQENKLDGLDLWIGEDVYSAEVNLTRAEVIVLRDALQRWLNQCPTCNGN